ncbi:MAG: gamma-glutamyl-gamma-aminobutyrate hydrolase family protein [Anaerolineales bacterium]|nr:MAG: gamma-glutamyl-gamma-aminobutyrate hydrolase family protein [Anaerolineales bacterium]
MSAPIVGLTTFRTLSSYGFHMLSLTEAYVQALNKAGASPVLVPLGLNENALTSLVNRLDGLLFTGGGDVHPERYGSAAHPKVSQVDEDRDRVEIQLLQQALSKRLPVMGICRGLQLINVGLGGSLYEDILDQHPGGEKHDYYPGYPRNYLAHLVEVQAGSRIAGVLGNGSVEVNSLHHQGIRRLGSGLKVTAVAPDGVIEAVELEDYPFGLAVQWHPEWLSEHLAMRSLFEAFVEAARSAVHA